MRSVTLTLLGFVFSTALPAIAQEATTYTGATNESARQTWQQLYFDGQKAFEQSNYTQAEETLKSALTQAESIGITGPVAMTLYNLGRVYGAENKLKEAEDCYKRSLEIYESSRRRNIAGQQALIKDYAKLLRDTSRSTEAEELEARVRTPTTIQSH